ncbi:MAG TPA: muconolactone Delta-isomerase family protein [Solirubrobacteraceae bacterium]|jgi:muconolactone delta-isomerase
MDFLVEFEINVPEGTPEAEVTARQDAESAAAAKLVDQGHLVRLWKRSVAPGESRPIGLYRAESEGELDGLLRALPLYEWMRVAVTPLEPHPNDPAAQQRLPGRRQKPTVSSHLPEPRLTKVYRLEATLASPLELGETARGHRRIVPLTGGTFRGPEIRGRLVPGASADWQTILPDGTALGDIRYVLETDRGDLLYIQSRSIRHGSPEVLARLGRGEDVDPGEYTFRASTEIETAAPELDWLNKGVFVSVGGRQAAGVIYETYLVG